MTDEDSNKECPIILADCRLHISDALFYVINVFLIVQCIFDAD